jgi:hypothetical protein
MCSSSNNKNPAEHYGSWNVTLMTANSHSYNTDTATLGHYIKHLMGPITYEHRGDTSYYHFRVNTVAA